MGEGKLQSVNKNTVIRLIQQAKKKKKGLFPFLDYVYSHDGWQISQISRVCLKKEKAQVLSRAAGMSPLPMAFIQEFKSSLQPAVPPAVVFCSHCFPSIGGSRL